MTVFSHLCIAYDMTVFNEINEEFLKLSTQRNWNTSLGYYLTKYKKHCKNLSRLSVKVLPGYFSDAQILWLPNLRVKYNAYHSPSLIHLLWLPKFFVVNLLSTCRKVVAIH